jgi:membrane protease subunit HflC
MMKNLILVLLAVVLLVAMSSLFIVGERQLAIKFQLGEIVASDYEPGLHVKAPWPINNVRKFDKRVLTLDTRPERFLTGEKKNVEVDFFVKWRIKNPAKYYTSFMGDERQAGLRLLQIVNNGLQLEFDQRTIKQVVSDDRSVMMSDLTTKANAETAPFGIEVVDVRIKRIELPAEVSNSVYARMRAERERIAKEHRAEGQEAAKGIQAIADRERTVILAEARRDAEILHGEGDARAIEIYADAYGVNQEYYEFYRSMMAYREALAKSQDVLVLEPDSEFFKYFSDYSAK